MNGQRTCVPTVGTGYILPEKPSFVCSYFIDTCVAMCACSTHCVYTVHVYRVLIVAIITRRYIYHQRLLFIFSRCLKGTMVPGITICVYKFVFTFHIFVTGWPESVTGITHYTCLGVQFIVHDLHECIRAVPTVGTPFNSFPLAFILLCANVPYRVLYTHTALTLVLIDLCWCYDVRIWHGL